MSEKWRDIYTDEKIKKLQIIEKNNLKVFIEICEKLHIKYFLYGGTLLGAIKYQGFIPWDDDIDVAMLRQDYMKFVENAPNLLPDEYVIQTPYDNNVTPFPYIKLRRKGTKFVEYINRNIDIENGIYMDIYPVDNIPDQESLRNKQYKNVKIYNTLYFLRQHPEFLGFRGGFKQSLKNVIFWVIGQCTKLFSKRFLFELLDSEMNKYNKFQTKRKGCLFSPNKNNIYENLLPLRETKFEELIVNIPGDSEQHLFRRYGDYTQLPPEEKRYGHIPYILDFGDVEY